MKLLFTILTYGLITNLFAQSNQELIKALTKDFSENSTKDGRWVFYSNKAGIKKIEKSLIKAVIPTYDFYEVTMTNYLGWHINQGTCVVLFDSIKSKTILFEPLWYGGATQKMLKLFVGHKFRSKDSLLSFLEELNELMQIGSGYKFKLTSSNDTAITYDLGYFKDDTYTTGGSGVTSTTRYNEDGIWRKIIVETKELSILRFTSINPVTKDKEIIE